MTQNEDVSTPKVITCETTGSCGTTRRAYKQELNKLREEKRKSGVDIEDSYTLMLEGRAPKKADAKNFSPFGKKIQKE